MILKDGTDTRETRRAYDDPMAIYLDHAFLGGDPGDDLITFDEVGEGVARYGRRLLSWDSQGFIYYRRCKDATEAQGLAEGWLVDIPTGRL